MWILKLIVPYRKGALLSDLAHNCNVSIVGYPITSNIKKNAVYVTGSGFVQGENKNIKKFIRALKKEKRVINFEFKNNFFIANIKQHKANKYLFQPGIFHIKPSIVNRKGDYIFELGSWEKEKLTKLIQIYKKFFNGKLIYIKQKNIVNIQTINIYPNLTEKQKYCLQLAINNHYYDYPRKITLKELAKIAKISYSTYQFHLQNAEKKMMPFLDSLI